MGPSAAAPPAPVAAAPPTAPTSASANAFASGAQTLAGAKGGQASTIFNTGGSKGLLMPATSTRKSLLGQ